MADLIAKGLDQFGGTSDVSLFHDGAHVVLMVEATSGSNVGESMLTPVQARRVARKLDEYADLAEADDGV